MKDKSSFDGDQPLVRATRQYETYMQLAELATLSILTNASVTEPSKGPTYSWNRPIGLAVRTK